MCSEGQVQSAARVHDRLIGPGLEGRRNLRERLDSPGESLRSHKNDGVHVCMCGGEIAEKKLPLGWWEDGGTFRVDGQRGWENQEPGLENYHEGFCLYPLHFRRQGASPWKCSLNESRLLNMSLPHFSETPQAAWDRAHMLALADRLHCSRFYVWTKTCPKLWVCPSQRQSLLYAMRTQLLPWQSETCHSHHMS